MVKRPRLLQESRVICAALALMTVLVYWRVAGFDFVSMDDYVYVAENPQVLSGLTLRSIRWAFTTTCAANWHPLTWLSLMLDTDISGCLSGFDERSGWVPDAQVYHVTNVLLHALNAVLLYLLFARITRARWPSAFAAAAFAVHPLHVESVAWIAERKDVLSTAFWLLVMLAYVQYAAYRSPRIYVLAVVLYALGLMAKPMLVTLPIVLILMDWWPLRRLRCSATQASHPVREEAAAEPVSCLSAIVEKLPFFALAAASCAVTYWAQGAGGAVQTLEMRPLGVRMANAAVSYVVYLIKTFYPARLAAYYPHPGSSIPSWQVILSVLILAGITLLAIRARRSHPWIIAGWLWYIVTLIPVIGLVQVGDQSMADRYTYVPLIGIFTAIAFAAAYWLRKPAARLAGFVISLLAIAVPAAFAYVQIGYWRDGITLFEHTIAVTSRRNAVALFNLGVAYQKQACDNEEAVKHYRAAVRVEPRFVDAYYNLGNALTSLNRLDEAWLAYRKALKLNPENPLVHGSMGYLLAQQGKIDEAIREFREALRIDPNNADARYNLELLEDLKQRSEP